MKRLLLVEDDSDHAYLMAARCEMAGATPTIVGSYHRAVELLTVQTFDLVLLDLGLPDSPLEQTIQRLPSLVRLGSAIVVITGVSMDEGMRAMIATSGVRDVMGKSQTNITEKLLALLA